MVLCTDILYRHPCFPQFFSIINSCTDIPHKMSFSLYLILPILCTDIIANIFKLKLRFCRDAVRREHHATACVTSQISPQQHTSFVKLLKTPINGEKLGLTVRARRHFKMSVQICTDVS